MLHQRSIALDKIVTSPLLRARQTTDWLLKAWEGPAPEVHVCDDLAPDAKPRKVAKYLRKLGGDRVALVGHLPHIALYAAWLLGSKKAQIDIAKAGIAYITCGIGPQMGLGAHMWLVSPAWY